jgi:hypothetical protein
MLLRRLLPRRRNGAGGARTPAKRAARPWPVTANAMLLVIEALGFVALGALYLGPLGDEWPLTPQVIDADRIAILTGTIFAILAVLALVSSLGFLRVTPSAWLLAVLTQGTSLLTALVLYFGGRPAYVYAMMVFGVLMVLYLHQTDVQIAFRVRSEASAQENI